MFLTCTLAIPENRRPDWVAACDALAAMSDKALEELEEEIVSSADLDLGADVGNGDGEQDPGLRELLHSVIDRVRESIEELDDKISLVSVAGWMVFTAGGLTHSDPPSEAYEAFNNFIVAGLAEAAGFTFVSAGYDRYTDWLAGRLDDQQSLDLGGVTSL